MLKMGGLEAGSCMSLQHLSCSENSFHEVICAFGLSQGGQFLLFEKIPLSPPQKSQWRVMALCECLSVCNSGYFQSAAWIVLASLF